MTALSAEIQRLPLAQLVPSPFNARSVRTEARIAEDGQRKPMIGNKTAVRYKMLRNLHKSLIRIWISNIAHLRDDIFLCPNWRHALFFALVLCVLLPFGARAEISGQKEVAKVPCPADTVQIQITDEESYGWRGSVSTFSAIRMFSATKDRNVRVPIVPDPHFRPFVVTVTEHIAARLAKDNLCIDSAESKERSLLQYMHWYLRTTEDVPTTHPVLRLEVRPSNGCRISSPWIDLAVERGPVPWVRGIVRWNNRQFLADQAVLAGAQNVPLGVATPLTNREVGHFMVKYHEATSYSDEPTAKQLEEIVPPDLLWLFRRSGRGEMLLFGQSAHHSMNVAAEKSAEGYTKLVLALIDRCFVSDDETELHYTNILDAADLIPLEQYRIDKLRD